MGLFDWLGRGRPNGPVPAVEWHVSREAGDIVAEDGRGMKLRVPLSGTHSVRIVPLAAGDHHRATRGGWQVALSRADGDVPVGNPLGDWRSARRLAQLVCETSELPLDELTQKMFSRVGQYTPAGQA